MENRMEVLRKIQEIELPYGPAVLLLGTHHKKYNQCLEITLPPFTAALVTIAKIWTQSKLIYLLMD